jgi:glucose-6-phosphate-specific signal transduction histidine kinase
MGERKALSSFLADVISWAAKVWSLGTIGLVLLIFVGEAVSPSTAAAFTPSELLGLLFFPIGMCLGLLLAWRREALGGAITVASVVAFYVWNYLDRGTFPRGPYFLLLAAPGVLFSLAALLSRSTPEQFRSLGGEPQPPDSPQS